MRSPREVFAGWIFARRLRSAGALQPLKLNIGAGGTAYEGWISAEKYQLDITRPNDFARVLGGCLVERVLAEHVMEHIFQDEFEQFLIGIRPFMSPGGTIRIAVPDAQHPSEYVRRLTEPGGLEPGAEDHKEFYSIYAMREIATSTGYELEPLEYFDENGVFCAAEIDWSRGHISRSIENYKGRFTNDPEERQQLLDGLSTEVRAQFVEMNITYTSLIVDFVV